MAPSLDYGTTVQIDRTEAQFMPTVAAGESQPRSRNPIKFVVLLVATVALAAVAYTSGNFTSRNNHQKMLEKALAQMKLEEDVITIDDVISIDAEMDGVIDIDDGFDFGDLAFSPEADAAAGDEKAKPLKEKPDITTALPDMSQSEIDVMAACSKGGNWYKVVDTLQMIRDEGVQFDSVYEGLIQACGDAFALSGGGGKSSEAGGGGGKSAAAGGGGKGGGGGGGKGGGGGGGGGGGPVAEWMKGYPRGELFYVAYGTGQIRRMKIDEVSSKVFYEEPIRQDLVGPKDINIDVEGGKIIYSDMDDGVIRKVDFDGKGVVEVLVKGETKSAILASDFENRWVYYTCMLSDPDAEGFERNGEKAEDENGDKIEEIEPTSFTYGIKRVPMDPEDVRNGNAGELVTIPSGQAQGMDIEGGYLYFSDYYEGTLSRLPLDYKEGDEPELLLAGLTQPQYIEVDGSVAYITNDDGHEFVYVDLDTVSPDTEPTVFISDLNGFIDGIHLDGEGGFLWTDKQGMLYRADLDKLLGQGAPVPFDPANDDCFSTVGTGLDKPKGFAFYLWPKSDGLSFKAYNRYNRLGVFPYVEVHEDMPWVLGKFVEPARETDFTVMDPKEGHTYEWVVEGDNGEKHKFEGPVVPKFKLFRTGKHPLLLTEKDQDGNVARQLRSYAEVKYVRRELRTYFEDERERFLDAMRTMVDTPTRQGKMIYGPAYFDMMYYTNLHNQYAGDRFCDHMHNGMGFLPEHLGLTLAMEQGMQVVDPELTVPYWDFTIEGHEIFTQHGGDFEALWDMQVFSADWFGDGGHTEYHTVTEGRWAWQRVEDNCWTCVHNSYGFLRAPWNINNSPYIQRWRTLGGVSSWNVHEGWPICEFHHFALTSYDTWDKFSLKIASEPHGAVHGVLGGTFNSDKNYDKLDEFLEFEDALTLRAHSYNTPKNMWRTGVMNCPDFCPPSASMDECKCSCGPEDELMRRLEDPETFDFFYQQATAGGKLDTELTEAEKKTLISVMCSAGTAIGDQLESASPADVIFWPIHPTIERLFFWRLMKKGFTDATWPEEKSYRGTFYKDLNENCYGHGPNDVMPWFIKLDDENQKWGSYYTGAQFVVASNSADITYSFPFVYDNYVWPHCEEEGYDFQDF